MTNEEILLMALTGSELATTEFQPQNNEQAYLAYAVGLLTDADALPEPRTKEEILLYQLALNGAGGDDFVITDARYLFYNGARLDSLDEYLSRCVGVTACDYMFGNCAGLTGIDLSGLDTTYMDSASGMFNGCSDLAEITGLSAVKTAGILSIPHGTADEAHPLSRLVFRTDVELAFRGIIDISYCHFTREATVEMFNSLPDITGVTVPAVHKQIVITGNPCLTGEFRTAAINSSDELMAAIEKYGLQNTTFTAEYVDESGYSVDVGPLSGDMEQETYESLVTFPLTCLKWNVETLTDEDSAIATDKGWLVVA